MADSSAAPEQKAEGPPAQVVVQDNIAAANESSGEAGGAPAAQPQNADSHSVTSAQTGSGSARLAWESKNNLREAAAHAIRSFWSKYKAACSAKQIEVSTCCTNTSANLMHLVHEGIHAVAAADAGLKTVDQCTHQHIFEYLEKRAAEERPSAGVDQVEACAKVRFKSAAEGTETDQIETFISAA